MSNSESSIPLGFCQCGCGGRTAIAKKTDRSTGRIEGQPMRYIRGHQRRTAKAWSDGPNPSGLCGCGCGRKTPIAARTNGETIKGRPQRFCRGHSKARLQGAGPNPSGLCMCGCGEPAPIARSSWRQRGVYKGQPLRFINGHARDVTSPLWAVDQETGCWIWQRAIKPQGYGYLTVNYRTVYAHRHVYEQFRGCIPEGMQLDHLCVNRACVNPEHLEPVTNQQNAQRAHNRKRRATEAA